MFALSTALSYDAPRGFYDCEPIERLNLAQCFLPVIAFESGPNTIVKQNCLEPVRWNYSNACFVSSF